MKKKFMLWLDSVGVGNTVLKHDTFSNCYLFIVSPKCRHLNLKMQLKLLVYQGMSYFLLMYFTGT